MSSIKQEIFNVISGIRSNYKIDDIFEVELNNGGYSYELRNLPPSSIDRSNILKQVYTGISNSVTTVVFELRQRSSGGSVSVTYKSTPQRKNNFSSGSGVIVGKQNGSVYYAIKTNKVRDVRKPRLTPGNMGVSRGTTPLTVANYYTISEFIAILENKIDSLVESETIASTYAEWIKLTIQAYNPLTSTAVLNKIQTLWSDNPGMLDEINSEMLEIFCPLAYIKSICNMPAPSGVTRNEKNRFNELTEKTGGYNANDFKIWFPQGENFPIIDSQVGYFESGKLVAVIPLSTKNITGGANTVNTLKFVDMFKTSRQVANWYGNLPAKAKVNQQVQSTVAMQAAGRQGARGGDTTYVIHAVKSIFDSVRVNANHKNDFLGYVRGMFRRNGIERQLNIASITSLIKKISPSTQKKQYIDNISGLSDAEKQMAKMFVVSVMKDAETSANSKYGQFVKKLSNVERIVNLGQDAWSNAGLDYPYTYQNLCLFFEKALAETSYNGPKYNYQQIVKDNYFTGNRSLLSKYGNTIVRGAGEVVIVKTNVHSDGVLRIQYDSRVTKRVREHYGLRSKNSINRLDDALGIAP
jgi:hypothetical protein